MKKIAQKKETGLIIRPASLSLEAKALIQVATPPEFVKERPIRGGKTARYIEGGYVIARLNQVFSPVGWDFEVVEHILDPKEVIVKGKLTVKDHKNGRSISKTQYGTHPRYAEVPTGDALKAAATDCLKKCASLFGIGLDIYWQQLDEDKLTRQEAKNVTENKTFTPIKLTKKEVIQNSLEKIKNENDPTILSK
jgi:hypothetical protein